MSRSKERRVKYAKEKRDDGPFVALPSRMIRTAQFIALSSHAVKLLIDLLAQYQGDNNGDLCATWTLMKPRGWKSRSTLCAAIRELTKAAFIAVTRQGGKNTASLYGVTFYALDPMPKFDITAAEFPRGQWARTPPGAGSTTRPRRSVRHAPRVNEAATNTPAVSIRSDEAANDTPGVSVKREIEQPLTRPACTSIDLPSPGAAGGAARAMSASEYEWTAIRKPSVAVRVTGDQFDRSKARVERKRAKS